MGRELKFKILRGFDEFNAIKADFLDLFHRFYGTPYPVELWEHFYRDIPCGPTQGVSIWNGNQLVGLSILLAQELVSRESGRLIPYGINVTTWIDPQFRYGGKTYFEMMRELVRMARRSGFLFLLAYPNRAAAYLPITHLGKFQLLDSARFVRIHGRLGPYVQFLKQEIRKSFFSGRLWEWRLRRFPYQIEQGYIGKLFRNEPNILDWLEVEEDRPYHGIFPFWSSFGECPFEPVDDYIIRLCYYPIDPSFEITTIKKSVMYSDVY